MNIVLWPCDEKTTPLYILLALQIVFLVSCAGPSVKRRSRPIGEASTLSAWLDQGMLSTEAITYLKKQGLPEDYRENSERTVAALQLHLAAHPTVTGRLALIEICRITANRVEKRAPKKRRAIILRPQRWLLQRVFLHPRCRPGATHLSTHTMTAPRKWCAFCLILRGLGMQMQYIWGRIKNTA